MRGRRWGIPTLMTLCDGCGRVKQTGESWHHGPGPTSRGSSVDMQRDRASGSDVDLCPDCDPNRGRTFGAEHPGENARPEAPAASA